MRTPNLLARIRRHQRNDKNRVHGAEVLVAVLRIIFRIWELLTPPAKRQKLRQLKQKLDAINAARGHAIDQIKHGNFWAGMDAIDAIQERYSSPEDREKWNTHRATMQAMRQENNDLQGIHKASGGDRAIAVQSYREYIALHPKSSPAHSYLGGALQNMGDLDGSLHAYRESLRMVENNSTLGAFARVNIASVLHKKGQTDAALTELQTVIDNATPQTASIVCQAFSQRGTILNDAGRHQEARDAWKQARQWDTTTLIAKRAHNLLRDNP